MKHDHVLKMFKFDPVTPPPGSGGEVVMGKIFATMMLHASFPFI